MQRTPKTSHNLFSSQPNLSSNDDTNELVRNMNLRKRRNPEFDQMADLKDSIMHSLKNMLNEEIGEMKKQNMQILASNNEIIQLLQTNATNLKEVNEKLAVIETDHALVVKRVGDLESQLDMIQKERSKNMVEIRNLQKQEKEDLGEVLSALYRTLDIQPMTNSHHIYRKGKNTTAPIVIEFQHFKQKEDLLSGVKKFYKGNTNRVLNAERLGVQGDTSRIYVSEVLTPMTKKNLRAARDLVKNGQFKYCWISRGNVLLRRQEGDPAVLVKSIDQVTTLRSY